jgi:hypothetical protein
MCGNPVNTIKPCGAKADLGTFGVEYIKNGDQEKRVLQNNS